MFTFKSACLHSQVLMRSRILRENGKYIPKQVTGTIHAANHTPTSILSQSSGIVFSATIILLLFWWKKISFSCSHLPCENIISMMRKLGFSIKSRERLFPKILWQVKCMSFPISFLITDWWCIVERSSQTLHAHLLSVLAFDFLPPCFRPQYDDRHDERKSDECASNDIDRWMDKLGLFWLCHK